MENTNDKTAVKRYWPGACFVIGGSSQMEEAEDGVYVVYDDHVAALAARAEEARREADEQYAMLLPGPWYMDPPDGGSVSVLEQVRRMAEDAAKWRAVERRAVSCFAEHPDDLAVDRFAAAMKDKMAASRAKGRGGWSDPNQCQVQDLARMLVDHVEKGDPVDIGNFAMMLWNRKAMGFDIIAAFLAHDRAAQRTAGGDDKWLKHYAERIAREADQHSDEFADIMRDIAEEMMAQPVAVASPSSAGGGGVYQVREIGEGGWRDATKEEYDRCQLDPHMDTRHAPVAEAEAAAQADDTRAQFNGFDITKLPPILISCVAKLWPGSNGLFWESALEKMPERIEQLMRKLAAAPTAGLADDAPKYETMTDHNGKVTGVRWLNADRMPPYAAAPTAQPTSPDDVQHFIALAMLGFRKNPDGSYEEARNVLADVLARAVLRQPGAPAAAPRTRWDINVAHLAPAVRTLHDALIRHDSAAMTLYARDDQVAWSVKGAMNTPINVTVGQLREVLVAALGLPAGTKFGG